MKTKKLIGISLIVVFLVSCQKFLEPYPNGNYDDKLLWENQQLVQGLIGWCYDQVNSNVRNYNDNEGAYLDGATDDAVLTNSTHVFRRYALNAMPTSLDPFQTYWDRDYRAIRNCNLFLKDRRGYNTKFVFNTKWNDMVRNRLQGEAFALRAWFQLDLLQKFGGKANGQMLGFPIVKEVYETNDVVNLARNTYDECVAQILADCDSAYKYLPIAHRDYLVPVVADRVYAGGKYWGHFDGISAKAMKAMVYLTWASPRFNPGNLTARWDSAASNAMKVMNFKMTTDVVAGNANSFSTTAGVVWTNPNSAEIVMTTRYNTGNLGMEKMFYPGGFGGGSNGELGATQELVNSFPMANGYPITDPLSGYNPANPYAGRDPRFYSIIFYNQAQAKLNNTGAVMYTFSNWNAGLDASDVGADAAGTKSNNSRTNYHIKKYIFMGWNPTVSSPATAPHSKFLIRWSHMVLTFAEAANHVTRDPNVSLYGMTPKAAIKLLRTRKTYDNASTGLPAADPYLDAQTSEAAFDALVKNERRIETCFEGTRFYDLRRWTTDANWQTVINQPVHGANITKSSATPTFTYDLNFEVEKRNFPSPYNPIPYNEIMRMSKLVQNDGWQSWN